MTYLAWAVMYEGESDAAYFNGLIPRLLEDLAIAGTRLPTIPVAPAIRLRRGSPEDVAVEACAARDAFWLVFIHADTGGRGLAGGIHHRSTAYCEAMRARCEWPTDRCIVIAPGHETEAWVLADPDAVTEALGYSGSPRDLGLPADATAAERIIAPKATLLQAVAQVRGRRRQANVEQIYPAVALRQNLDRLRGSESFQKFEQGVRSAMEGLGCL
jgi:hypothetical protein